MSEHVLKLQSAAPQFYFSVAPHTNLSLFSSSADIYRSHEEQSPSVHHRKRRGEWPSADARLPQGRPHRASPPPELRPRPGLLRAPVKTKNPSSALFHNQEKPIITPPTKTTRNKSQTRFTHTHTRFTHRSPQAGERRPTEASNPTTRGDDLCPSGFSKRSVETTNNLDLFCSCAATRVR